MQGFLLIMIIGCIVGFIGYKIDCWKDERKKSSNGTQNSKDKDVSDAKFFLAYFEEAKIFATQHREFECCFAALIHEGYSKCRIYIFLPSDNMWKSREIEQEIDNSNYMHGWEVVDCFGRKCIRMVMPFSTKFHIGKLGKALEIIIKEKHPNWNVDRSYGQGEIIRVKLP